MIETFLYSLKRSKSLPINRKQSPNGIIKKVKNKNKNTEPKICPNRYPTAIAPLYTAPLTEFENNPKISSKAIRLQEIQAADQVMNDFQKRSPTTIESITVNEIRYFFQSFGFFFKRYLIFNQAQDQTLVEVLLLADRRVSTKKAQLPTSL